MYLISTPWFTLPPAFWFKIAKMREPNEATVDIVAYRGYLVMLLEDLKWFANMWTGDTILPQFQKIDYNPLILSPGCHFRLPVSFDGGESLDKNIHDLKKGKWFSFCILQLPKKQSPWSLNLSDPCFTYF